MEGVNMNETGVPPGVKDHKGGETTLLAEGTA